MNATRGGAHPVSRPVAVLSGSFTAAGFSFCGGDMKSLIDPSQSDEGTHGNA